ncbi:hypothetical protein Pla110_08490 [Polystyrenella longa]|uniref:Rhamnogalacturonan lyase domain-containing protein n=1 Tax=Polystyrenella longa TaxID=2528007 RepID=A0A518CIX5_9PLAN|nr:methylamine utilization protein [Polystyrenella longa]QDU79144.1 hypothetical protein Pla110_08490 [Polystyrenella longa]
MKLSAIIKLLFVFSLCLSGGLVADSAFGDEPSWGNFKGRFVYQGDFPETEELVLNKDIEYCAPREPKSEKLIVNKENMGLSNVVIYLYQKRDEPAPPIHPDYQETAEEKVLIDNIDCTFKPHVSMLRTSQTLKITNSDDVAHNTAAFLNRNNPFNAVTPIGDTVLKNLEQGERLPVQISCSIHPWMQGWLLVQEHPYMAVSDADGNFEIKNLPAGEWTFQFWHESAGYVADVTIDDQPVEWKRGRLTTTISEETYDLGTVNVAAEKFGR